MYSLLFSTLLSYLFSFSATKHNIRALKKTKSLLVWEQALPAQTIHNLQYLQSESNPFEHWLIRLVLDFEFPWSYISLRLLCHWFHSTPGQMLECDWLWNIAESYCEVSESEASVSRENPMGNEGSWTEIMPGNSWRGIFPQKWRRLELGDQIYYWALEKWRL